ncbi:hypothetical protein P148_SR1C00001G0404 [candidate division SR1 bacterium RAAC1_SR1_1]|nr:hypothetical protein P148_SR1C00001G0404 [candidate division SR1 bacterium RAAC1_SR1_1]
MTDLTKEIKEATDNKLNCKWEDGEKTALKSLGGQLDTLKDQKDPLKDNINTLGNQTLPEKNNQTLRDFLENDVKGKLVDIRAKRDKKSEESKTVEAANIFVQEVANELQTICGNNSDIVMALQIYVNGLNDLQGQHATIPYNADKYGYKAGDQNKRLFIDGFLGPHTYNALWLAIFKEEMPQIKTDVVGYIKEDGTVYLPGKDGKYKPHLIEKNGYTVEGGDKELPPHFQKLNLFLEFYEIYKDGALKVANSRNKLNSSRGSDEGAAIKSQITNMDKEITDFIEKANSGKINSFDYVYDIIFAKMNYIEKGIETVLGQDDLEKTKKLFTNFDSTKYKELELDMLDINRRKFGDAMLDSVGGDGGGNSDAVKSKLMERILERSDFDEINKIFQNPETIDIITKGEKDKISKILIDLGINEKDSKAISKEIIEEYIKIKDKNNKDSNQKQFKASIESQATNEEDKALLLKSWNEQNESEEKANNNGEKIIPRGKAYNWDDYLTKATDFMIKESTNTSTLLLLQELMIEGKIQTMFDANQDLSKDKDLAMMKDILGVGTWDISDNNLDYAIEAGQTIALAAVTMGAGAIAARVALAAVKYGSTAIKATKRGTGIVSGVNNLSKGGKLAKAAYKTAKLTKWGLKTGIEGVAFYQGSNIATNVILPDRSLFENVGDRKEMAKSAAFVGVLKGLGTAFSKLANTKLGQKINLSEGNANTVINTNGLRIGAPKALVGKDILQNFGKILVQGGMLTGTSQGLEFVFSGFNGEAWNPTWEEFIQACLLSRMAEGAGKLPKKVTFKKRGKTIELVDGGKNKIKENGKEKGENSGKDKSGKETNISEKYSSKDLTAMNQLESGTIIKNDGKILKVIETSPGNIKAIEMKISSDGKFIEIPGAKPQDFRSIDMIGPGRTPKILTPKEVKATVKKQPGKNISENYSSKDLTALNQLESGTIIKDGGKVYKVLEAGAGNIKAIEVKLSSDGKFVDIPKAKPQDFRSIDMIGPGRNSKILTPKGAKLNIVKGEDIGLGWNTTEIHTKQCLNKLYKAKKGQEFTIKTGNGAEQFTYKVNDITKTEIIVDINYTSPSGTIGKYGANRKNFKISKEKLGDTKISLKNQIINSSKQFTTKESFKNFIQENKGKLRTGMIVAGLVATGGLILYAVSDSGEVEEVTEETGGFDDPNNIVTVPADSISADSIPFVPAIVSE